MRPAPSLAALTLLAYLAAPAHSQAGASSVDANSANTDAVARAALAHADVRRITGEVRTILGTTSTVSGRVTTLEAVGRELERRGLRVRNVPQGLEVMLPGDVLFDFDKATIRTGAVPVLEAVADAAKRTGSAGIRLEGHTDSIGSASYNQSLSRNRADAVLNWLARAGIERARLSSQGFGAARPVAPNRAADGSDNPAGRQLNRRVTATFRR